MIEFFVGMITMCVILVFGARVYTFLMFKRNPEKWKEVMSNPKEEENTTQTYIKQIDKMLRKQK